MLTIKYCDKQGREQLVACKNAHYVPDTGDAESFGSAGLYYDVDAELDLTGQYPIDARGCFPATRTMQAGDRQPIAYVMNEAGSTVAQYSL